MEELLRKYDELRLKKIDLQIQEEELSMAVYDAVRSGELPMHCMTVKWGAVRKAINDMEKYPHRYETAVRPQEAI